MSAFISGYEQLLYNIAEISALTLELVGIVIIAVGSIKSLVNLVRGLVRHHKINIVIELGKTLALALEFKMGAEIIKTVIIHNLDEKLAVLAIVIAIRALLAVLIHWEIRAEKKEAEEEQN